LLSFWQLAEIVFDMNKFIKKAIKVSVIVFSCLIVLALIQQSNIFKSQKNYELMIKVSNGRQLFRLLSEYKNIHGSFPSELKLLDFEDIEKLKPDINNWYYKLNKDGTFVLTAHIKKKKTSDCYARRFFFNKRHLKSFAT